jgi:hypothetical protein
MRPVDLHVNIYIYTYEYIQYIYVYMYRLLLTFRYLALYPAVFYVFLMDLSVNKNCP